MIASTMPFSRRSIWPLWRSNANWGKRWTICYPLCAHCSSRTRLSKNLLLFHHPRLLFLCFLNLNCFRNNWELYNLFDRYFYLFVYLYINLFSFDLILFLSFYCFVWSIIYFIDKIIILVKCDQYQWPHLTRLIILIIKFSD